MFDLQLPRHISTLPVTSDAAMQRFSRYRGNSGHAADIAKPTQMTQMRHQHGRTIPLCGLSARILAVVHNAASSERCGRLCRSAKGGDECDGASSFHSRLTS